MSSTSSKPKRAAGGLHGPRPQPLSLSTRPSKKPRVGGHAGPAAGWPVIVYERTPRIVHADPHEFMAVVQRLTGNCKQRSSTPAATTLPPEATSGASYRDGSASTSTAADALALTLGQQQQRAPCGGDHPAPPSSPAAASPLLSPSGFFFSPATMQAIRELIS